MMVNETKYYRHYSNKLIEKDPTEIVIVRKVEEDDDYGGVEIVERLLLPQTVRLYETTAQYPTLKTSGQVVGGGIGEREKILCRHDADILEGDRFQVNNKTYEVIYVKDYLGINKQCIIRADSNEYKS